MSTDAINGNEARFGLDGQPDTYIETSKDEIGVKDWWKAEFEDGSMMVSSVKVHTRLDCCAELVARSEVQINNEQCGMLPSNTQPSKVYEIICPYPIVGWDVKVSKIRNGESLSFA